MRFFTGLLFTLFLTLGIFHFNVPEVFAACPPDCGPIEQATPAPPVTTPSATPAPPLVTPSAVPAPPVTTPSKKTVRTPGPAVTIANPLGEGSTLTGFASAIISVLLVFITPIIVLAYIFAGFKYVISRGNPEEIKKATTWLLYISIGAVLSLGAFTILKVLENTINAFKV